MTPFNWLTFLEQAMEKEPSGLEAFNALGRAASWPTCATGQLCKELERDSVGCPTDLELMDFGMLFHRAIADRNWPKALSIFRQIETRTTQLLSEQTTKEK